MAFHLVSMIQTGLDGAGWWVNFYLDDMAWLEQFNLLDKLKDATHCQEMLRLLDALQVAGYALTIYQEISEREQWVFAYPEQFLAAWAEHRSAERPVLVSVELEMSPEAPDNDHHLLPFFVRAEFERLLPLYRFCSWDPERNSYLAQP